MKGGLRKRPGNVPKGIWTGPLCQGFSAEPMESLLEELTAKRNGMATEAPSRIVLDLTRLHDTSPRKVCRQTQEWETSTKVKEDGQFTRLVIVQLKPPAC
jgi:hypothetical protein